MEHVPKHATGNHYLMFLMTKSWWFVMFVMVFVVENIRISVMFSIVFFQQGQHGFCDVICHKCTTLIAVILWDSGCL